MWDGNWYVSSYQYITERWHRKVPVIVLWTKTESLDLAKIKQLMKEGKSKSEAMQQAPQKAWADFEKNTYQQFDGFIYPPKAFVVFRSKCYIHYYSIKYLAYCVVQRWMSLEIIVETWLKRQKLYSSTKNHSGSIQGGIPWFVKFSILTWLPVLWIQPNQFRRKTVQEIGR